MIGTYEVGSTFKTTVTYKSGTTYVDPSGNMTFLSMKSPDGAVYMTSESGQRTSQGIYKYYVSTQTNDQLGLYTLSWLSYFNYSSPWDYKPKIDRETVSIVSVD